MAKARRWNTWTRVHSVQLDHEDRPEPREVRLCSSSVRVGHPVRVNVAGAEVEGVITRVANPTLHVKLQPAHCD
jgi:hypothetical protein